MCDLTPFSYIHGKQEPITPFHFTMLLTEVISCDRFMWENPIIPPKDVAKSSKQAGLLAVCSSIRDGPFAFTAEAYKAKVKNTLGPLCAINHDIRGYQISQPVSW